MFASWWRTCRNAHRSSRTASLHSFRFGWAACDAETPALCALMRLRLLTAQRGGELARLRWTDVEEDWMTCRAPRRRISSRTGPNWLRIPDGFARQAIRLMATRFRRKTRSIRFGTMRQNEPKRSGRAKTHAGSRRSRLTTCSSGFRRCTRREQKDPRMVPIVIRLTCDSKARISGGLAAPSSLVVFQRIEGQSVFGVLLDLR